MDKLVDTGLFVEEPTYSAINSTEELIEDDKVISDCNSIAFRNAGTTSVTVMGLPLEPTEQLAFRHDAWVVDRTVYPVKFTSVEGMINKVIVVRTTLSRRQD